MGFGWLIIAILLILSGYIVPYFILSGRPFLPAIFWALTTLLIALFTYLYVRGWKEWR